MCIAYTNSIESLILIAWISPSNCCADHTRAVHQEGSSTSGVNPWLMVPIGSVTMKCYARAKLLPLIGLLRIPKVVSKNLVNPFSDALVERQ